MCQSSLPGSACSDKEFEKQNFDFGIVDKVKIPDNLPTGDYVIGFRWDSEQTPQVWNSCADVTVKASGKNTKAFTPTRGCTQCCVKHGICSNCTGCLNDKTGDCAYCWKPLKGFHPGTKNIYCLGYESPDGHAKPWVAGETTRGGWSPGCTSCWAEGCHEIIRDLEEEDDVVV
jgi:hypothetical protein